LSLLFAGSPLEQRNGDVALLLKQAIPCIEGHAEPATLPKLRAPTVPKPDEPVGSIDLVGNDLMATADGRPGATATTPVLGSGVSKLVYQLIPVMTGRSTSASSAFWMPKAWR
jgi:hypothetical protein